MPNLQTRFCMEKKMGKRLGACHILQQQMQTKKITTSQTLSIHLYKFLKQKEAQNLFLKLHNESL